MSERSRREKKSKLEKLAEYKRVREGGGRVWKEDNAVDLYDEVTEDQYKSIVRGRLEKDDFVVDDGVSGYMDNGMDDWAGEPSDADSDVDDRAGKKKSAKNRKGDSGKAKSKPKAPPPPDVVPSISDYRPVVSAAQEDDFMSSILGTMDTIQTTDVIKRSRKRKPSPTYSPPSSSPLRPAHRAPSDAGDMSSDGPWDDDFASGATSGDDMVMSPYKRAKIEDTGLTPAIDKIARLAVDPYEDDSFNDIDMNDFMDVDDDLLNEADTKGKWKPKSTTVQKNVDIKPARPVEKPSVKKEEPDSAPSWLSVYDSLAVATEDTLGPLAASSAISSSNISALEPDGSLRFFWIDYLELDGRIYFIGKLKDKNSGAWVSCCVTVEGVQRNLFVLPRERRVEEDEEGQLQETDDVPVYQSVYNDFDRVRKKIGIKLWKAKPVKRKYAFGEPDVPKQESQWMKVVYGFDEPQIPINASSPNIARIFGTNTSAFELLVLKRKIMGPCWLKIVKPEIEYKGVSWCKLEATVTDPKDINPFLETDPEAPKDIPPLTVMSLTVRTIMNHKENKREVVCATARIWHNLQIDDPTPPEQLPCSVHTFVRPLDRFPVNFEARAKASSKGVISPTKNERMLLNSLLITIYKADPDAIVGHEFLGVSLDVLLHRMRDLKADHWSRIGRFRRSKWPTITKQGANIKFLNGRLVCDLASDGAKGMITSTTWSLTEMCATHLKSERQEIDQDDTASYLDGSVSNPEMMLTFVRHCELDAHYQMAIASRVQILPLTKQLTNLAGNAWNKTLNGGRAERNEYILLHEFHRLKYVCPDKLYGKKAATAAKLEIQDDDPDAAKMTKGKKDKYKGGLVFDPKRGLWDKFILVMDFNSLYPSIIQEYNIDFTTVERVDDDDGDAIPEPPPPEVPQGVLPRLIATLVNRRRQVKSLMKDKTASPAKLLQYDIKQMALKLTANSMYGCLGFEYSRFYARPLAALTTFKGREILTHTRELAESLQLDVIYGDTDSVFVNSNVTELSEALRISADFKKAVNDRYKLLEIDLDSIFQRLLLLQKKKYAALKQLDGTKTSIEVKGLDMIRREYCALSKQVCQYVLDQILSSASTEVVVSLIHEYLSTVGENVRGGKVKVDDFIVFKRLGKNPEDYPDGKSLPHVQVALRMKGRGGSARSGDVIPYVFCRSEGEDSAKSAQADRARHPDEYRKSSELSIDYEYYLSQQILPPIERLCDPIEGTDRSRLAESLGLDPGRHRVSTATGNEWTFTSFESQTSDKERFKNVDPFTIRCRRCKERSAFTPINDRASSILLSSGPTCPKCHNVMNTASIQVQMEIQIRNQIGKYYEAWTVCDEPTCRNRTRYMGVYGRRCQRQGCRGTVAFEYSDVSLYNQLRFYAYLFDAEKVLRDARGTTQYDELLALTNLNATFLHTMRAAVEKYLDLSARRWVDLGALFSFMKV